jgi:hypothetical protein
MREVGPLCLSPSFTELELAAQIRVASHTSSDAFHRIGHLALEKIQGLPAECSVPELHDSMAGSRGLWSRNINPRPNPLSLRAHPTFSKPGKPYG